MNMMHNEEKYSYFCDCCGTRFYNKDYIGKFDTKEELMKNLKESEWEKIGETIYCPDCLVKTFGKK